MEMGPKDEDVKAHIRVSDLRESFAEGQRVSSVLWVRFPGGRGVETRTCTLKDSHF